ncbi:MAG: MFS transporter, partial [Thermoplasmata archaeon]|nr:MFS transporter [Thermoplasmata archaeon]
MSVEKGNEDASEFGLFFQYGERAAGDIQSREVEKAPSERVKKIRDLYFETSSSVSMEFPYWYTRRWVELEGEIPIIRRAEALKSAFSHLTPAIFPGELLVMGKTHYLRGSFPMPWLSGSYFMSKEDEMYKDALEAGKLSSDVVTKMGKGGGNVTESAGNIVSIAGKFGLRKEELPMLLKTARSWKDRSVEDIGHKYEQMVPEYDEKAAIMRAVICMFDSGYTLPQGREVMDYYYPLRYGLDGIIDICNENIGKIAGYPDMDRLYFYKAVISGIEGIQKWTLNHAKEARRLPDVEKDDRQKQEYIEIVDMLEWLSHKPPRTFKEALQLTWIFHAAVLNEDCISGMSPGRLGQVLYPWWKRDMDNGSLTREKTIELLECMRMKYTELDCFASMGVVGGVLSGNTFNNLCIGGLDKNGHSGENELDMLILESAMTCDTPQPTLSLLYDEKTSEELLIKGVECTKIGTGYPAWVSNRTAMDFIIQNYKEEGMDTEEARAWSIGGCLESSAGTWHPIELDGKTYWIPGGAGTATSVGVHFIGLPKMLEMVLCDGYDNRTSLQIFEPHGYKLETYDEVIQALKEYFSETVKVLTLCNNIQHDAWRKITMPVINSFLKPDCLQNGRDIGQMGARYNTTFNVETCGTINLINSLASLKRNVYEEKNFSLEELKEAISKNFGYKHADE